MSLHDWIFRINPKKHDKKINYKVASAMRNLEAG